MFGDLNSGPQWNYEVPRWLGVQFHLQNLEFKTPTKNLTALAKTAKFRCLVIWNRGPGGTMRSPVRWGYNSTFKTSNSEHPQTNLTALAKTAKFRCLVIWNRGPHGIMRPPAHWGSNSTFTTSNSEHPQKNWLFEPKRLNLDVWWFEIGVPVELWGPPCIGGLIPPSKPWIQNTYQKNLFFETKYKI
jgi:hypothetical protein